MVSEKMRLQKYVGFILARRSYIEVPFSDLACGASEKVIEDIPTHQVPGW